MRGNKTYNTIAEALDMLPRNNVTKRDAVRNMAVLLFRQNPRFKPLYFVRAAYKSWPMKEGFYIKLASEIEKAK